MFVRKIVAASLMLAAASASALADDVFPGKITGSATLTTDYLFRGISQTDNDPAVQAGLEWGADVGSVSPYVGVWGSNLNFTDANLELDWTAGLRGKVGEVTWDLGVIYYTYPSARSALNYDYVEVGGKLGYDFGKAVLTVGLNYSPDFFAASGDAVYLQANLDVPLPWGLTATGHIGRQWIENNARFGAPDYADWSFGVAKDVLGLTLGVAYADTTLSKGQCFGGTTLCGGRVLATATKKF